MGNINEEAEKAKRIDMTTDTQVQDIDFSDLNSVNTRLFQVIVKNICGYYAQRTKSQILTIFGKNFWICESKKQTFPDKCKECYLNPLCNSYRIGNARENMKSWCAFDSKHVIKYQNDCPDLIRDEIIKYQNDCPDGIRDEMTDKATRTNTIFNLLV